MIYIQEINRETMKNNLQGTRLAKYVDKLQDYMKSACQIYTDETVSNNSVVEEPQPKLNYDYQNFSKQ